MEYASKQFSQAQQNYSVIERKALAVIWAIVKFLDGLHFVIHTDHRPLKWLMSINTPTGRLARWALSVQHLDFDVEYIHGKLNSLADLLSRSSSSSPVVLVHQILLDEQPIAAEDFREMQLADSRWGRIILALESGEESEKVEQKVALDSGYTLNHRVLYRLLSGQESMEPHICIPECMSKQIIRWNHDSPEAAHPGVAGTCQHILVRYYWSGMRNDVMKHIESCVNAINSSHPMQPLPGMVCR